MKKRILVFIAAILLLSGCSTKTIDLQNTINQALAESTAEKLFSNNMNKQLYSYYLPTNIGRYQSTQSTNVFCDRGRKFIMNLNVANIIQDAYYKDQEAEQATSFKEPIAQLDGGYADGQESYHAYTVSVYDQQGYYITVFESDVVEFYAVSNACSVAALCKDMMRIARSLKVNVTEVKNMYSHKQNVDYKSEKIELFEQLVPESGRVEELFDNKNDDTDDASEKNEDGPKQITNAEDAIE